MKGILFNTDMVRAILDGRKTVTRRVVKPQPTAREENPHKVIAWNWYFDIPDRKFGGIETSVGPYRTPYRPGDILYVRETFAIQENLWNGADAVVYKASCNEAYAAALTWTPSIHMPREAARIFLRVTDVRVERLQDITERGPQSAEADGCVNDIDLVNGGGASATKHFADLWDSTVNPTELKSFGWDANPWVWVIEFERISREEAMQYV